MGFDIRLPIGIFFTLIGLILSGYGLLGSKAIYGQSLGINVNLGRGIVLFRLVRLWGLPAAAGQQGDKP